MKTTLCPFPDDLETHHDLFDDWQTEHINGLINERKNKPTKRWAFCIRLISKGK
jgi:hypothetical protein